MEVNLVYVPVPMLLWEPVWMMLAIASVMALAGLFVVRRQTAR